MAKSPSTETDKRRSGRDELLKELGNLTAVRKAANTQAATEKDDGKEAKIRSAGVEADLAEKRLKHKGIEEDLEDQKANRKMRFKYSTWVFAYLVCYSLFVGVLLILAGTKFKDFHLDDEVLKFLVGSTAVSAIGLVAAVTTGLFHKK